MALLQLECFEDDYFSNCTLLMNNKATDIKFRPNFAKLKIKVNLAKLIRDFFWIGIKNEDGVEGVGFKQMV